MKRMIAAGLFLLLLLGIPGGCGSHEASDQEPASAGIQSNPSVTGQSESDKSSSAPESERGEEEGGSEVGQGSHTTAPEGAPIVYMTTEISAQSLVDIYKALDADPQGRIAVKLSTGEPGSNYLRTDLIGQLVQSFDSPTIVECNTAYGGSRSNPAMHYQVAEDHGYTAIAKVDIMDENGSMTLPVTGGTNLTENYVGANFANYD